MPNNATSSAVEARAMELHRRAVVVDCHCDMLMPIADGYTRFGMDTPVPQPGSSTLAVELPEGSHLAHTWPFGKAASCIGQYNLPKFLAGGLTAEVCAVFVEDEQLDVALQRCLQMVWWFHREMEDNRDRVIHVTAAEDIRRAKKEGKVGAVLALEGFEPLGLDTRMLDIFYRLGVRMAGMAHNRRSAWCDGTLYNTSSAGLTPLGKQGVKRMNELGVVVDIGHLTATGIWEVLSISTSPVVLSHRSPRKFFPLKPEDSPFHPVYDLSQGRERMEALAKNGGVFGVFFLGAKDVGEVVSELEYVTELVGPDHVGLGSDLYGVERAPIGLEDMSKVPAITRELVRRGHSDENILKWLGENFMRVFQKVWKR